MIELPSFLPKRKNPLEAALSQMPLSAAMPQPEPQQAEIPRQLPENYGIPQDVQDLPMRPIPVSPSLKDAMSQPAPGIPSRLDQLQQQHDQGVVPNTTKGKLGLALATFAPTALGALFGGTAGAAGAAEGTVQAQGLQRDQQNLRQKSLQEQMENERRRQEREKLLGIQTNEKAREANQHDSEFNQTQARIVSEGDKTRSLDRELANQKDALGRSNQKVALRKLGYDVDEQGTMTPLDDAQLSPQQRQDLTDKQALGDLRKSQQELAAARTEVEKAKNDPSSPAFKLAQRRLDSAAQSHSIAQQRLGLSEQQFEMRAFGTNQGQPLNGAMIGDNSQPTGTAFQQNVRPTGQERNKADLANSAHEQLQSIKSIVQNRPDIFGPAQGRKTDFTVWLGSQDPDAQRFRAARTIAGDHLAGVFGGRSEAALTALDDAIGHFKDNPAAVAAGLDQLDKANDSFIKAGTVKTVGSNAGKKNLKTDLAPKVGDVQDGYVFQGGDPANPQSWKKK